MMNFSNARWMACFALLIMAWSVAAGFASNSALASSTYSHDRHGKAHHLKDADDDDEDPDDRRAAVVVSTRQTARTNNYGATLEPGEPTLGGLMQKTVWARLKTKAASRVVVHTFGSDMDTVLAAYRGTTFTNFSKLGSNDNKTVQGFGTSNQSLVVFDTTAGGDYRIQAGSKTGAEGDIYFNVTQFAPGGGLASYLATVAGFPFQGRDYICPLGPGGLSQCETPGFILYNATSKTLTVEASTTLGPGVTPPAGFSLAPGAAVFKTFTFEPGFDTSTVRAISGKFIFTAKSGTTIVSRARHKALIYVKAALQPDVLSLSSTPQLRSGFVNQTQTFRVRLKNNGAVPASGCFFASRNQSRFKTEFQRINPETGVAIGAESEIFGLAPGKSATFEVRTASQEGYSGDPEFDGPVSAECADTAVANTDLVNAFDISAAPNFSAAEVYGRRITPASDTLSVPAGGSAETRFSAVNEGPATTLTARAVYIRPFGENEPQKLFGVSICRTATSTGPCLAPLASSVTYNAAPGAKSFFRMRVTPPTTDPGFDPGKRRVYVKFEQALEIPNFGTQLVGVHSIAVKRQ